MTRRTISRCLFPVGCVALTLLLSSLVLARAWGAVLVVRADGGGLYENIQEAVDAAHNGDVIELTDGVFQGAGNGELDLQGKSLTFRSQSGNPQACVVSLAFRPFISDFWFAGGVTVQSIKFTHGDGISLYQAGIVFTSCIFEECAGVAGGGYCSVRFNACTFLNAQGSQAGVGENGTLVLDHCAVRGGTATPFNTNAIEAIACTFEGIAAEAVAEITFSFFPGSGEFEMCQFKGNHCSRALISASMDAYLTFGHCTFAGNDGTSIAWDNSYGFGYGGEIAVTSCTFADNTGAGAEIDVIGGPGGSTLSLDEAILSFRQGGPAVTCAGALIVNAACTDVFGNSGGDWTGCLAGLEGTAGNISADPFYCRAMHAGAPYMLRDDSPCLPHGSCGLKGAWGPGCRLADVAAAEDPGVAGLSARPNPFTASTRILLARAPETDCTLTIHDSAGRRVRAIAWPAHTSADTWDGTDDLGRPVPAGMYVYRIGGRSGTLLRVR